MKDYSTQKSDISQGHSGELLVLKHRSETLSDLLVRVRGEHKIPPETPVTYAGRLDPMADGLVLILYGETCKQKDAYLGFDKTYVFEVLLGVSTDTFDVLGKIIDISFPEGVVMEDIRAACAQIAQKTDWAYPPYSSRPYEGKPLFEHARLGTLPSELPSHEGHILSLSLIGAQEIAFSELCDRIVRDVDAVSGDFRQGEIIGDWKEAQESHGAKTAFLFMCEAEVSSGMYIRSIASELGKLLGVPALAYSIKRVQIGDLTI